ncbi:hypothetical protein [Pseudomonas sp. PD9R]|uniref:hypothetical protein n=1 Tax=Pseudomonas sp. PD9R TaxID=2853534 RepID=UPI001C468845|nr:hypothetical protein [Pseudomonas sp. PD9R]MBV6826705.1 hypothetical protein [Pseudomonas sp. PD9R]
MEDALGKLANSGFERLRYRALKQLMRLAANSPAMRLYDGVFRIENNNFSFCYSFKEYAVFHGKDRSLRQLLHKSAYLELPQAAIF